MKWQAVEMTLEMEPNAKINSGRLIEVHPSLFIIEYMNATIACQGTATYVESFTPIQIF